MFGYNMLGFGAGISGGVSLVEVANSAVYNSSDAQYLVRTFGTPTDQDVWTISMWLNFRLQNDGVNNYGIFGGAANNTDLCYYAPVAGKILFAFSGASGGTIPPLLRDALGWTHFVMKMSGTSITAYYNGVQVFTDTMTVNDWNSAVACEIGTYNGAIDGSKSSMYMAETVFIDGLALEPTSFGEYDITGLYWTPKSSTAIQELTFGNNGFYLNNATNPQTDASGNGNNFTNVNTVVTSTHTPTNTEAVFNPLKRTNGAYSNGNRHVVFAGGSVDTGVPTLIIPDGIGKWYAEFTVTSVGDGMQYGICAPTNTNLTYDSGGDPFVLADAYGYRSADGYKKNTNSSAAYGDAFVNTDIIGIAYDAENGTIWFSNEGVWQASATTGEITAGTTTNAAYTGITGDKYLVAAGANTAATTAHFNEADWTYTAPTGFLGLNTTNIAAATTRTQSNPYEHWNNILYTGNGTAIGSGGNAITGAGFQPDFGWIKGRSGATEHVLTDIVRGVTKELSSNDTGASETVAEGLTAFGSDGFTVGSDGSYNTNTATYVAWLAKLGGAASTNEDGTIDSSVSVNQTLGMSVGTFTSGDNNAKTIGHGLGVKPLMVIVKVTSTTDGWATWHTGLSSASYKVRLSDEIAQLSVDDLSWNATEPTSSVFSVKSDGETGATGRTFMFMAFAPSEYISIGSYEGNSNANGTFIPTLNSLGVPIQPVWWLHKCIDTALSWYILDSTQQTYNVLGPQALSPNTAEATPSTTATYREADFVSGGVKIRGAGDQINKTNTHIYMAIGTPIIDVDGRIIAGR